MKILQRTSRFNPICTNPLSIEQSIFSSGCWSHGEDRYYHTYRLGNTPIGNIPFSMQSESDCWRINYPASFIWGSSLKQQKPLTVLPANF